MREGGQSQHCGWQASPACYVIKSLTDTVAGRSEALVIGLEKEHTQVAALQPTSQV